MTTIKEREITEVIPRTDVNSFLTGIENTLATMSFDEINAVFSYSWHKAAVVMSFDGAWKPFFGFTRGYNHPEERTYLKGGGAFLALVRSRFRSLFHEIPGGRVFLESNRAYRVTNASIEEVFLRYIWLSDTGNPVVDALWLMKQALSLRL